MKPVMFQLALFFAKEEERPDKYMHELNSAMGEILNVIPVVNALPENAPKDFPVVSMFSENGVYNVNISKTRIDLFVRCGRGLFKNDMADIISKGVAENFFDYIVSKIEIARVGIVKTAFIEIDNPARVIADKYLRENEDEIVDLTITKNTPIEVAGERLNKYIEVGSSKYLDKDDTEKTGIQIVQDYNLRTIKSPILSKEIAIQIIKYAWEQFDEKKFMELISNGK